MENDKTDLSTTEDTEEESGLKRNVFAKLRVAAIVVIAASIGGILALRRSPPANPAGDDAERWFVSQRAFPGREIPAGAFDDLFLESVPQFEKFGDCQLHWRIHGKVRVRD